MQCVMEVLVPLRVQAVAAGLDRPCHARVVAVVLRDHHQVPPELASEALHLGGELFEEMGGRGIDDRMHRVKAQAVDVIVAQPHQGVVDEEAAHGVTVRAVEVHRVAPRGVVAVGEIRPELREVVAVRAEVVVDHVQQHRNAPAVTGIDQAFQAFGPSVGVVRGIQVDPVVAPAALAGELRHRHQLQVSDAEFGQVVEPVDHAVESARRGEGADVDLLDHRRSQWRRLPASVVPDETGMIQPARRAVYALRLPGGARIGERAVAVDAEGIVAAVHHPRGLQRPPAVRPAIHWHAAATALQFDLMRLGGPHANGGHGVSSSRSSRATGNASRISATG